MPSVKEMLIAIAQSGLTQGQIATAVGVSQPTIYRAMQKDGQVFYETGKKIEELYRQKVPSSAVAA